MKKRFASWTRSWSAVVAPSIRPTSTRSGPRGRPAATPRPCSANGWPRGETATGSSSPPRSASKWRKQPGLSAANIRSAVEGSLRRLKTEYIDLYYAHEDDPKVEQAEYLRAFDALVKEGKVRVLGASNFEPGRLSSALAFARREGLAPFRVSQDHWNLVAREFEEKLLPLLEAEGLQELPYWSLASGFLTGKYRPGVDVTSARSGGASKYLSNPDNVKLLGVLDEVAEAHGVSVSAVSLAWLKAHPVVGAPIASARTVEQLDPFFEAARITLTGEELERLSNLGR